MEYSMYFCPDCKNVYKVYGENKTVMCAACKNKLIDMKMHITEWEKLSKEAKETIKKTAYEKTVTKPPQKSFFSNIPEKGIEPPLYNSLNKSEQINNDKVGSYSLHSEEEWQNVKTDNENGEKDKQVVDSNSTETKKASIYSTSTKKVFKRNKENTYAFVIFVIAFLGILGSIIIGFFAGGMQGLIIGGSGVVTGVLLLGFSEVISLLQDIKDILLQ